MIKIGNIFAGVVMTICLAFPVRAEVVDRIVAIVNDDIITLSELNGAFDPYLKKIEERLKGREKEQMIAEGRKTVMDRLIESKLIEQQAKRSGMTVKDEEVMDSIKDILKRRNISMADFIKVLEREGETFESYKKDIHDQLLRQRLIRREIQSKVVVSDEEIGEYYSKHREEYEGKEAVRLRQILLPLPIASNEGTLRRLREEARAIREKIAAGEPFEMFAAKYAQTPALAAAGGDIGYIERGHLQHEVEEVAFHLKIDEVSEVIETEQGLLIIKVVDRRGAGLKSLADVRQEIVMKIEEQKMLQRFDTWIAEVKKKAYIEIRL